MLHVNFYAITHRQSSTLYLCSMGGGGDYSLVPRIKILPTKLILVLMLHVNFLTTPYCTNLNEFYAITQIDSQVSLFLWGRGRLLISTKN